MAKLLLIDGHSILNRAYYALPLMTNKDGVHTNAVYGFLNIMMKFVEEEKPDYLAVAFDTSSPTFRHKIYSEYKGTRKGMDSELREQVPIIQDMLRKMEVPIITQAGIEADDILGTLSKRISKDGIFVTIVSGDRDLLQIADENIKISIPKTKRTGTEVEEYLYSDVVERIGVTPGEFIDVKALWGDSSDNIPGVPGIGEKGAISIISQYKTLDNAIENAEQIKGRAGKNLIEFKEQARLSRELALIHTDCDIDFDINTANISIFTDAAYRLCEELELKSFLKRFPAKENNLPAKGRPKYTVVNTESMGNAISGYPQLKSSAHVGIIIDKENIVLGFDDILLVVKSRNIEHDIKLLLDNTRAVLVSGNIKEKILNRIEDIDELSKERFFDIFIAQYLIDPTRSEYKYIYDDDIEHALECYAEYEGLNKTLCDMELDKLFFNVEMPLSFTLSKMEKIGIYMDSSELSEYNKLLSKSLLEFEQEIYEICGEEFNINSPKQLGYILFEKMNIPGGRKTKTGYSTAADVLEKLAADYPVVKQILLYRQYSKLKSTYAIGLMDCVAEDNRIHTSFQQTVTATGRLSSINPNLQNIPIRTKLGREIRRVFKPKPGYIFIDADYSQIELRVLAHTSGDENLIEAYRENKDIHRATAAKVFRKKFEDVTDSERSSAKAVNFGIVYGISSFGLGQDLNISRAMAQSYIDDYYKAYPSLKAYLDSLIESAKELGYTQTMFGRKRPVPEINSKNFVQRSFGERICMNTPIQGSAADIIKIAMINVDNRLRKEGLKSRLILQVHDELLIEALEEEKDVVCKLLSEEMESAVSLKVPLICEIHQGYDWYSAK